MLLMIDDIRVLRIATFSLNWRKTGN